MVTKDGTVRLFRRAAAQRLTAAELLLDHGFNLDAKYLAGYGVECALKALIFERTSHREFSSVFNRLTSGQKAHDYEMLKALLRRQPINVAIPAVMGAKFRLVATWETNLRYKVISVARQDARAFVEAVTEIVQWAERM